jgi:hypothetical protein
VAETKASGCRGRLLAVLGSGSPFVTLTLVYDSEDGMVSVTASDGPVRTYVYDVGDRLSVVSDTPASPATFYDAGPDQG